MKKKHSLTNISIFLLVLLLYNILVFIIPYPNKYNLIFWVSWLFGILSLVTYLLVNYYVSIKNSVIKSILYKIPLIKANIITTCIQIMITIIFIVLNAFFVIPFWTLIVIEIVIILFTVLSFISSNKYINILEQNEEKTKYQISFVSTLLIEINNYLIQCSNLEIKEKIEELYEVARYSDPISSIYSKQIEEDISSKISKLNFSFNDIDKTIIEIDEIIRLLKTRNTIIKANK